MPTTHRLPRYILAFATLVVLFLRTEVHAIDEPFDVLLFTNVEGPPGAQRLRVGLGISNNSSHALHINGDSLFVGCTVRTNHFRITNAKGQLVPSTLGMVGGRAAPVEIIPPHSSFVVQSVDITDAYEFSPKRQAYSLFYEVEALLDGKVAQKLRSTTSHVTLMRGKASPRGFSLFGPQREKVLGKTTITCL